MKLFDPNAEAWIPYTVEKFVELVVMYGHALVIHEDASNLNESFTPNEYKSAIKEYIDELNKYCAKN